jgi:hypothetical protein
MKIQELRIGNYVEFESHKFIIKDEITFDNDEGDWMIDNFLFKEIKPIKLNEYWLRVFGFEIEFDDPVKHAMLGVNPVNKNFLIKLTNCQFAYNKNYWFYGNGYFKIKYVHQLQNLYFSLTGTEMKLATAGRRS